MTATEVAAGAHTGYAIGSESATSMPGGNGGDGELGNGTTTEAQATPVVVSLPAGVTATALAAGEDTAYADRLGRQPLCVGNGVRGALGNGTTTFAQATPVVVSLPAAVTATAVAAGAFTGYAIGSDGNLYAWGSGGDGELGNGTTTETQATPVVVSLPAGDTASAVGAETYSTTAYAISVAPLTFTPAPLAFGNVLVGTSSSASTTVTYTTPVDPAYGDIGIVSATPVGPDAADFSVTSNSCSHFIYLSGAVGGAGAGRITGCSVTVQFTPSVVGRERRPGRSLGKRRWRIGGQDLALSGTGFNRPSPSPPRRLRSATSRSAPAPAPPPRSPTRRRWTRPISPSASTVPRRSVRTPPISASRPTRAPPSPSPAQTSRATSSARSRCSSPRRSSGPRTQTWQ